MAVQFGPVTNVDFCQEYPYNFAVTASTRVSNIVELTVIKCTQPCMLCLLLLQLGRESQEQPQQLADETNSIVHATASQVTSVCRRASEPQQAVQRKRHAIVAQLHVIRWWWCHHSSCNDSIKDRVQS
jgi:hypothetical protein